MSHESISNNKMPQPVLVVIRNTPTLFEYSLYSSTNITTIRILRMRVLPVDAERGVTCCANNSMRFGHSDKGTKV